MPPEFEIAGHRYRFDGMKAQTETRIQRRFAPLIAEALPLVLASGSRLALRPNIDMIKISQAVFGAWGKLTDDDTDNGGSTSKSVNQTFNQNTTINGAENPRHAARIMESAFGNMHSLALQNAQSATV